MDGISAFTWPVLLASFFAIVIWLVHSIPRSSRGPRLYLTVVSASGDSLVPFDLSSTLTP